MSRMASTWRATGDCRPRWPTPSRSTMVLAACRSSGRRRSNEVFSEGQLDECELTLKDLNGIAAAMVRALEAVYHRRPEYPGRPSGAGFEPKDALPQLQLAPQGAPSRDAGSAAAIKLVTGERRRS